ncbi:MAG: PD-(D/E)XK nuclease family protein [Methylacidiphilales bacterium]|nr:PD-(D/E)XK nuclease family protein [Candidatus Methylacidiphilales bacterium]
MAATRLYFTASTEEQWRALAGPWLREQAGMAWKNPKPTVVLTPSRAESFYLRSRLVDEGLPFLGLRFWTPSDARKFLLAESALEIGPATQAELRLVARACAEKLARKADDDNATLASVIREPNAFLRACDLLLGAGWDPAREGAVYGRALAQEMERTLQKFRLASQPGLHRQLRREALSRDEPLISQLLVVGFNATHWPLWDLLKAVVFSAEQAVVALSEPRVFAEEIDQLWISSWEEIMHTESINPVDALSADLPEDPFATLAASYERGEHASGPHAALADLTFCVTPDLASHIHAVVLQALDYLKSDSCARLGIVFPEANALALGVAEELRRLGIPLDDGTGALAPGLFEKRGWQSWLALQEEPGVRRLIAWLRACEAQGVSCGLESPRSVRDIAEILDGALGETLVDDLDFLTLHLQDRATGNQSAVVADFLRRRIALPETATFARFLALTREALALPGWEDYLARLKIDPPLWLQKNDAPLSRRTFLEWLKESTASQTRTRGADGNHFYGKVHLLIYAQMTGQTWSHLILTGLNEGVWPRVFETGAFGSRHELAALNQQARALNRLGAEQGGQGMGHETVGPDRGHCLLPLERRDLASRDLCAALESTGLAGCLTAMTTEGGVSLLPSDFFNHAFQAQTGRVLDEETFRNLANATREWRGQHRSLFEPKPDAPSRSITATKTAYAARRNPALPFGPYEFAYARPPRQPIQLSCKKWEDAWNHPAQVWLEEIVGSPPWPEGTQSWQRAIGTWVHHWLAASLRKCHERNSANDFLSLLLEAADREARLVRDRARAAKLELYPWWDLVWEQARVTALSLGEILASHLQNRQFLAEFRLPPNVMIALSGTDSADFSLKGRIDLLLVEPGAVHCDFDNGDFSGCTCWVVDFKTGSAQNLSEKKIGEGIGLQTLLYALAARALGATSTAVSLHTADAPLKPQVQLEDLLGIAPLFHSLDKFHRDGLFGMRADADNAYGYSPAYPMATRFVSSGVLKAKWALVHGGAPAVGGDE